MGTLSDQEIADAALDYDVHYIVREIRGTCEGDLNLPYHRDWNLAMDAAQTTRLFREGAYLSQKESDGTWHVSWYAGDTHQPVFDAVGPRAICRAIVQTNQDILKEAKCSE